MNDLPSFRQLIHNKFQLPFCEISSKIDIFLALDCNTQHGWMIFKLAANTWIMICQSVCERVKRVMPSVNKKLNFPA